MALDDPSQRSLDKIGGIIAAALFGVCLVATVWQWARHRCHPLGVLAAFLVMRIVGWMLAFIGAARDDPLLNKRGYIVNSLAFWLMMLSQLLLLARWDAARRGARWGARSWGGTGGALVLCLVFGALDAAGQITWLNSPSDSPSATLKVASVGFVVLAGVYGLGCLFFNFREGLFYQRPSVRWVFFLSALVVAVRCVCWMLVGLDIVRFKEPKRLIFLFCLTTTFEIVAAAIWGFTRATKHLRLEGKGAATKLESLRSEPVAPAAPQPAENSILTHTVNARPSSDSEADEDAAMQAHNASTMHTAYSTSTHGMTSNSYALGAHASYYQPPSSSDPLANPWASATQPASPGQVGAYAPRMSVYAQPSPAGLVPASPYASGMARPGQPVLVQQSPQMHPQLVQVQQQPMQLQPQPILVRQSQQMYPQQMQVQQQPVQVQQQPFLVQQSPQVRPQSMQVQPQPVLVQQSPQMYSQPMRVQPQQVHVQQHPAPLQTTSVPMYSSGTATRASPAVGFVASSQPQYVAASAPPADFAEAPYPTAQPAQVSQVAPGQAHLADYTRSVPVANSFARDDNFQEGSIPRDVATMPEPRIQ